MGKLSFFDKGSAGSPDPYPMFIAKTGSTVQPITSAPTPFTGPSWAVWKRFMTFGTGNTKQPTKTSTLAGTAFMRCTTTALRPPIPSLWERPPSVEEAACRPTRSTPLRRSSRWAHSSGGRPATDATTTPSRRGLVFDLPVSGEKLISHVLDIGPLYRHFQHGDSGGCRHCRNLYQLHGAGAVASTSSTCPPDRDAMSPRSWACQAPRCSQGETSETKSDSTGLAASAPP